MKRFLPCLLFLALIAVSCTKNEKANNDAPTPEPPEIYPHGTPAGDVVKKTIGAAGGTLSSKDNTLNLDVPAGALAANTEISIQAVSNTLPGSPGVAYRLLPENVKFTKPVKLTFKYNDSHLDSTNEEALFMAYQSQDGIWHFIPKTSLNTTARTLTVETTHFSDWAPYAMFWLATERPAIRVKESCGLMIMATSHFQGPELDKPEIAVARKRVLNDSKNIRNWQLMGAGSLRASTDYATYTAPSTIPSKNPVEVSVEVHNFIPAGAIPGRGATGMILLVAEIHIEDDTYLRGNVNGTPIVCFDEHHKYIPGNGLSIAGQYAPNEGFSTMLFNVSSPVAKGRYTWRTPDNNGPAMLVRGTTIQPVVIHGVNYYSECDAEGDFVRFVNSDGELIITKVEQIDGIEYITGIMTGTLWAQKTCGASNAQHFQLYFRTKKH